MSEKWKTRLFTTMLITAAAAVMVGGVMLIIWNSEQWRLRAENSCKIIAEASKATEYRVDASSYNCYMAKDGKIIEVEDW